MKTNFEVWRDGLTVDDFFIVTGWCLQDCVKCPAIDSCDSDGDDHECKKVFEAWANAPAKGGDTP